MFLTIILKIHTPELVDCKCCDRTHNYVCILTLYSLFLTMITNHPEYFFELKVFVYIMYPADIRRRMIFDLLSLLV